MDEQRMQAYVELIQQLLGCKQEKEGELLAGECGAGGYRTADGNGAIGPFIEPI